MIPLPFRRAATLLLTAMAPVVVTALLIGHLFSATPRHAVPLIDDEVAYWNQIAAFSHAGMNGGYHTINEQPSRSGFSRFGPHGPAFAIAYGTLGRLFGWRPYSGALVSMILVTLAAAAWAASGGAGWWGAAAMATFWPLILFLPSTMQEPLHFAIAILLAAAVAPTLSSSSPGRVGAAVVIGCLAAGVLRPTWPLAALAVAWAGTRMRPQSTRYVAVGSAAAGAVVVGAVFGWLAAPYPGAMFSPSIIDAAALLRQAIARAAQNASAFVIPVEADAMEVLVRYEMLAVLILATVAARRMARERNGREVFVLALAGLTIAAVIVGGSVERWRDFRVMAPMLLLALLVWLPGRSAAPRAIVAANILVLPLALASFQQLHAPRFAPQVKTEYFARSIAPVLAFRPDADGWQNTVLMHVDTVDPVLVALPHGVALSVTFAWEDVTLPPRSRYLVLRPRDVAQVAARVPMRLLAATPIGGLYENEAAAR